MYLADVAFLVYMYMYTRLNNQMAHKSRNEHVLSSSSKHWIELEWICELNNAEPL